MHTLHGLRFAHVFDRRTRRGRVPRPRRAPALLDQRSRELLRSVGLDLLPEPRARRGRAVARGRPRAPKRASRLWRPRLDDAGRPAASSYYLHEAGVEPVDEPPAVQPPEAASARDASRGAVGALARRRAAATIGTSRRGRSWCAPPPPLNSAAARSTAPGRTRARSRAPTSAGSRDEEARWSASRLESYRTCAFQFFSRYALHLYEVEEELGEADAAVRGTVVHEILEDAVVPLAADGRPLIPDTVDLVIERVRSVGRRLWDDAPSAACLRPGSALALRLGRRPRGPRAAAPPRGRHERDARRRARRPPGAADRRRPARGGPGARASSAASIGWTRARASRDRRLQEQSADPARLRRGRRAGCSCSFTSLAVGRRLDAQRAGRALRLPRSSRGRLAARHRARRRPRAHRRGRHDRRGDAAIPSRRPTSVSTRRCPAPATAISATSVASTSSPGRSSGADRRAAGDHRDWRDRPRGHRRRGQRQDARARRAKTCGYSRAAASPRSRP